MSRYRNSAHTKMSASEYARYLRTDLHGAAWIDAKLMYQSARSSDARDFARNVLIALGVRDIPERHLEADVAARELFSHTDAPVTHAEKRRAETEMAKDAELNEFWQSVIELLHIYMKED